MNCVHCSHLCNEEVLIPTSSVLLTIEVFIFCTLTMLNKCMNVVLSLYLYRGIVSLSFSNDGSKLHAVGTKGMVFEMNSKNGELIKVLELSKESIISSSFCGMLLSYSFLLIVHHQPCFVLIHSSLSAKTRKY